MKDYRLCIIPLFLLCAVTAKAETQSSINCLALNIYHEARSEPLAGRIAVGAVTLTRAKINHATICKTVYAPSQFSWTAQKNKALPPSTDKVWRATLTLAKILLKGRFLDPTHGATHYFADYIPKPHWHFDELTFEGKIGHHLFYKEDYEDFRLTLAAL